MSEHDNGPVGFRHGFLAGLIVGLAFAFAALGVWSGAIG